MTNITEMQQAITQLDEIGYGIFRQMFQEGQNWNVHIMRSVDVFVSFPDRYGISSITVIGKVAYNRPPIHHSLYLNEVIKEVKTEKDIIEFANRMQKLKALM